MLGHRTLRTEGRLDIIRKVKRELGRQQLAGNSLSLPAFFTGAVKENLPIAIRQYLLLRRGYVRLHFALLKQVGDGKRFSYSFPADFRKVIADNGFRINNALSGVLFTADVFLQWIRGIVSIVQILFRQLTGQLKNAGSASAPYIFFSGLQSSNLPKPGPDGKSYDIISWYLKQHPGLPKTTALRHTVSDHPSLQYCGYTIAYQQEPFAGTLSFWNLFRFAGWAFATTITSGILALAGNWWYAYLLPELSISALVRFAGEKQIAQTYLFPNNGTVYRPLWSYEAEKKGSHIVHYFYSTFEEFKLPAGYIPNSIYWNLLNWPHYMVWDQWQEETIRQNVSFPGEIDITGSIWLSSSSDPMPDIPEQSVAVFDIPPIRTSLHFGISTVIDLGYGTPDVPVRFIKEIAAAASSHGYKVVQKQKREIGKASYKSYRQLIDNLTAGKQVIQVQPETSPVQVIEKCSAVLSMPFTSTAIIARELGKPSAFYDPMGVIDKNDKGAHGIPVLSGRDELENWFRQLTA
jgi:polysaccharide biosynthesis PFTS motif protein